MKLKLALVFHILLLVFSSSSWAGPARAQWLDSSHLFLKLPTGLSLHSGLHFYVASDSAALTQLSPNSIEMPLVSANGNYLTLSTSSLTPTQIDTLIRGVPKVYTANATGQIIDSTAIQMWGLLDDAYFYSGNDLGPVFTANSISLKLWAPTAQLVRLYVYQNQGDTQPLQVVDMQRQQGVWSAQINRSYQNYYYLYEVSVYQPSTDKIETSLVTDPYGVGLAINAAKTQLVDLNSPTSKPAGWDSLQKPQLNSINDSIIYELHLRDFSANDASMPIFHRGTYLAFTHPESASVQHLNALSQAGLTHVHLLPINDFGTVNEDKTTWQNYAGPSSDLQEPQNILSRIRNQDPYAWGYDPVHYFAPEGSYAVANDGEGRIREVRTMVQSLSNMGLRVVEDVVFNHTLESGTGSMSILDRIVPLYYYRMDDEGDVANSSCCSDTASEHRMMEKLMIDAVTSWAVNFKIDGFRFDLMSFHTHDNMVHVEQAVRALNMGQQGVDGSKILLYGEGWNFGSLYDRDPQDAMTQLNSFGLGIGFFNDRIRDAVRGGSSDDSQISDQGFVTGLYFDFNQEPANRDTPTDSAGQMDKLLQLGDVIKCGLAGNLRDYRFREHLGTTITAGSLNFRGSQVADAAQASETINYVSSHDGYSLWDAIQAKAPFYTQGRNPRLATIDDKRRMQQLAIGFALLGEGIPFIEGGSEILRSKSGDQDSYDSGDFFNSIDWSLQSSNWGKGLPPAWKNYGDWAFWSPRLSDPAMLPQSADMQASFNYVLALMRVRQTSPLFRLNSLNDISSRVSFIDNDEQAQPGLIVMLLRDTAKPMLVFFNASRNPRVFHHSVLQNRWVMHPMFTSAIDPALKDVSLDTTQQTITLPGRAIVILQGAQP